MFDDADQSALERKRQSKRMSDRRFLDKRYPTRCAVCSRRIRKGHNHLKPKTLLVSLLRDKESFNVLVLSESGNEFDVVVRLFDRGVTEAEARAAMERAR